MEVPVCNWNMEVESKCRAQWPRDLPSFVIVTHPAVSLQLSRNNFAEDNKPGCLQSSLGYIFKIRLYYCGH